MFAEARVKEWRSETAVERRRLAESSNISEDEVERLLAEKGLISLPERQPTVTVRPEPIHISGKPVSEMIIEERQ